MLRCYYLIDELQEDVVDGASDEAAQGEELAVDPAALQTVSAPGWGSRLPSHRAFPLYLSPTMHEQDQRVRVCR